MYVIDFWNGFICESGCWPRIYSMYVHTQALMFLQSSQKFAPARGRIADAHTVLGHYYLRIKCTLCSNGPLGREASVSKENEDIKFLVRDFIDTLHTASRIYLLLSWNIRSGHRHHHMLPTQLPARA
jgi:hypothetical protein